MRGWDFNTDTVLLGILNSQFIQQVCAACRLQTLFPDKIQQLQIDSHCSIAAAFS